MRQEEIKLDWRKIKAERVYHFYEGIEVKTFILSFPRKRKCLSTREGFKEAKYILNHFDPPALWDKVHKEPASYQKQILEALDLPPEEVAMLSTGVDMDNLAIKKEAYEELEFYVFSTAGVMSNAQRIGVDKAGSIEREGKFERLGTINIIVISNFSLSSGAMARGIITATEAKTIALEDLKIKSSYNPEIQATGTGTDNMVIVSGEGPLINYVGGHSKAGELMAKAVTAAIKEGIYKQNKIMATH